MKQRLADVMKRMRPHMVDSRTFAIVAVAFGLGVAMLSWHSKSLLLEIEAANLAWVALVAFGMTWHGEWGSGWRIGSGLVIGSLGAIASYYGAMSVFPVTPMYVGAWLGASACLLAFIAHVVPQMTSFAGAAVGFGIGIAAARAFPFRPTTPIDDLFALMLTASMCVIAGVFGSLALRAVVLRMGVQTPRQSKVVRFVPRLMQEEEIQAPPAAAEAQAQSRLQTRPETTRKVRAAR